MAEKRFVKIYDDGAFGSNEIWVDKETGVNYLFSASGYAGSCEQIRRINVKAAPETQARPCFIKFPPDN